MSRVDSCKKLHVNPEGNYRRRSPMAFEIIAEAKTFINSPRSSRSIATPRSLPSLDINDLPLTPKGKASIISTKKQFSKLSIEHEHKKRENIRRGILENNSIDFNNTVDAILKSNCSKVRLYEGCENQSSIVIPSKSKLQRSQSVGIPVVKGVLDKTNTFSYDSNYEYQVPEINDYADSTYEFNYQPETRCFHIDDNDDNNNETIDPRLNNVHFQDKRRPYLDDTHQVFHRTFSGRNMRLRDLGSETLSSSTLRPHAPTTRPNLHRQSSESIVSLRKQNEKDNQSSNNDNNTEEYVNENNNSFHFQLWKKATRVELPPAAIILDSAKSNQNQNEIEGFIDVDVTDIFDSSNSEEFWYQQHVVMQDGFNPCDDEMDSVGTTSHESSLDLLSSLSPTRKTSSYSFCDNSTMKGPEKWKLGGLLGEGTFGKVYKALDSRTGQIFVVKAIPMPRNRSSDKQRSLVKLSEEIAVMKDLHHEHIVRYRGTAQDKDKFYIFMEYVPGGSIASLISQFGVLEEPIIRSYTRQILEGINYLHSKDIIHRDIKGANVLVNEQGIAKLADFGCSKQLCDVKTESLNESLHSIRGSVPWMAPEVARQTGHDSKADIWSLGATVIEMASASTPWPAHTNKMSVLFKVATTTEPPKIPSHLSPQAIDFVKKCMAIDPKERKTASVLLQHSWLKGD